jgi:hypothetical protein
MFLRILENAEWPLALLKVFIGSPEGLAIIQGLTTMRPTQCFIFSYQLCSLAGGVTNVESPQNRSLPVTRQRIDSR